MWRPRRRDRRSVTCPACGTALRRTAAREYDKHGNRWEREGKTFEYLCKPCHDGLCLQRRDGLEALLCEIEAGDCSASEFLRRYVAATTEAGEPTGEQ